METKYCKYCNEPIPQSRKVDAIFCSDRCGWTYRNRNRLKLDKEKKEIDRQLSNNYKIVKSLHDKGITRIFKENLAKLGFNPDYYTEFTDMDPYTKASEVKIFDFIVKTEDNLCFIKKIEK